MKKIKFLIVLILAVTSLEFYSEPAFAKGNVSGFWITILSIQLKNAAGDWVTIENTPRVVDGLSLDPFYTLIKNKDEIPYGTYTNMKIKISEEIKFKGYDGAYRTKGGGKMIYSRTAEKYSSLPGEFMSLQEISPTLDDENEGVMMIQYDYDYQDVDNFIEIYGKRDWPKQMVIKKGSIVRLYISFQLKNQVNYAWAGSMALDTPAQDEMMLEFPKVLELGVRVDLTSTLTTEDKIEVLF